MTAFPATRTVSKQAIGGVIAGLLVIGAVMTWRAMERGDVELPALALAEPEVALVQSNDYVRETDSFWQAMDDDIASGRITEADLQALAEAFMEAEPALAASNLQPEDPKSPVTDGSFVVRSEIEVPRILVFGPWTLGNFLARLFFALVIIMFALAFERERRDWMTGRRNIGSGGDGM